MPGPLDARPGFLYALPMNSIIRIVCLGLCLALACPPVAVQAATAEKKKTTEKKQKGAKAPAKRKKSSERTRSPGEDSRKKRAVSGEGFRGLAWGTPLSALKEPELREQKGDAAYYVQPGDSPEVLGAEAREIVYMFCKGGLAGVLVRYDGLGNHNTLQAELAERYGAAVQSPENAWGDVSWRYLDGNTVIMHEYSPKGYTGALAWMSQEELAPCRAAP